MPAAELLGGLGWGMRAFRLGGEEFALLFPDLDIGPAAAVAEAVREAFSQADWSDLGPGLRVTASIGLAAAALLPTVDLPHSKVKENIAGILKKEGYLVDFAVEGKPIKTLKLKLKYNGRKGVIAGLRRVSKPGLRRYVGATEIPRVLNGMGISIVSTPKGVMTGNDAKKQNVGGELVAFVW